MNSMILFAMAAPPNATSTPRQSMFAMLLYVMLWSVGIGLVCYRIAKQKERRAILALVLGIIPGLNIFALLYIALASNKQTEKQLNAIMDAVKSLRGDRAI